MTYYLGHRSRNELEGVHPRLVEVVERAIALTPVDFVVHDGLRTEEEQQRLVDAGASHTMHSKHLQQPDGYGHAVDLVPWINERLRWEWPPIFEIAQTVQIVAADMGLRLRWGGVWDRKLGELVGLEREVEAYVERRRRVGARAFIDGPHFEMV